LRKRFADKNFRIVEREDLAGFIQDSHPFNVRIYAAIDHELCKCETAGRIEPKYGLQLMDHALAISALMMASERKTRQGKPWRANHHLA